MIHPQIDPVALQLGPLQIQWYGLMYLLGFGAGLALGIWRAKRQQWWGFTVNQVQDLLFYIVLGIIIGGRLGYVLFYQIDLLAQNPLYLLRIWEGGMSFHGGFLGVVLAVILFGKRHKMPMFAVGDFVAPLVPPGIFFGRLGNFINGELWGRPTESAWGMVFPRVDEVLRHPSQLYQMAGEGLALFLLLWWYSNKPRPRRAVSAMFMIGYGVFRTAAEFFRQPDAHLGIRALGFLTQGMILSIPMILVGVILLVIAYRQGQAPSPVPAKAQAPKKHAKKKGKGA